MGVEERQEPAPPPPHLLTTPDPPPHPAGPVPLGAFSTSLPALWASHGPSDGCPPPRWGLFSQERMKLHKGDVCVRGLTMRLLEISFSF